MSISNNNGTQCRYLRDSRDCYSWIQEGGLFDKKAFSPSCPSFETRFSQKLLMLEKKAENKKAYKMKGLSNGTHNTVVEPTCQKIIFWPTTCAHMARARARQICLLS